MKGFLKFITVLATAITAVVGALAAIDLYLNRNRVKGNYLECDIPSFDEEEQAGIFCGADLKSAPYLYICIEKMTVKCYNIMNYYRYKVGDKGGF